MCRVAPPVQNPGYAPVCDMQICKIVLSILVYVKKSEPYHDFCYNKNTLNLVTYA